MRQAEFSAVSGAVNNSYNDRDIFICLTLFIAIDWWIESLEDRGRGHCE